MHIYCKKSDGNFGGRDAKPRDFAANPRKNAKNFRKLLTIPDRRDILLETYNIPAVGVPHRGRLAHCFVFALYLICTSF